MWLVKMKVAILGHSFVRRLSEFSRDTNEPVHPEHEVSFHGKGGSKIDYLFEMINELPEDTNLIFIQSGGNDIHPTISPINIAKKMLKVAEEIIRIKNIPVLFSTIFIRPNPRYQSVESYDKTRLEVNKIFRKLVKHKDKVEVARHEAFFSKLRLSYMHEDGVHLNPIGQKAFLLYIRRAITLAMTKYYHVNGPNYKIHPGLVNKEAYNGNRILLRKSLPNCSQMSCKSRRITI